MSYYTIFKKLNSISKEDIFKLNKINIIENNNQITLFINNYAIKNNLKINVYIPSQINKNKIKNSLDFKIKEIFSNHRNNINDIDEATIDKEKKLDNMCNLLNKIDILLHKVVIRYSDNKINKIKYFLEALNSIKNYYNNPDEITTYIKNINTFIDGYNENKIKLYFNIYA